MVRRRRTALNRGGLAATLLLLSASAVTAQPPRNLDFEEGLTGWTSAGDAFAGQPLNPSVSPAGCPASPLGGDYWQSVAYPIGHHGRYLATSTDAQLGTLTSDEFVLGPEDRYFSILVGSSATTSGQRIELHVTAP